jgi:hypothetical protein
MASEASEKAFYEKILESPVQVGVLSFLFMAVLNFACLNNPPYWDDILGLHNQAVWLAKHNFNIIELWRTGDYLSGGSNIYKFGVIPYFYAVLYSLFPPVTVHVLGHLFSIGGLAVAFGAAYSLLRKFGVNDYIAFLWCAAVLCEPVMAGRSAALGQECPLICATLVSIYFIFNKKYAWGVFFILAAMLCKMTAGILAMAFVLWLLLDILFDKEKLGKSLKKYYPYLIAGIFLIVFFLFDTFSEKSELLRFSDSVFVRFFFVLKHHFSKLLLVQFAALCMVALLTVYQIIVLIKDGKISELPEKYKLSLFLLILCGGFWASYGLCALPLPRYSAFIVFPMYIFIALNTQFEKKYLKVILVLILLIFGIINIKGALYPQLRIWQLRSGDNLERSREFIDDLWANQGACQFLENRCFNRPIVAKWPYVQMLTVPEMGYVKKAMPNVYAACLPIKYAEVKVYLDGGKMPDNTLYIFVDNSFAVWKSFGPSLLPPEKCKIIFANRVNGGRLIIYEKRCK